MVHFKRENRISKLMFIVCILLFIFGVATLVVTTTFTVIEIVHKFQSAANGINVICNNTVSI